MDILSTPELDTNDTEDTSDIYSINAQYIDMRFTFSDQDKELSCLNDPMFMNKAKNIHRNYLRYMLNSQYIYMNKFTSGIEIMNRAGENCKCHFHLRFTTKHVVQSIRRRTKDFLAKYDQQTNGNSAMMFKALVVPRNEDEFWRYPIKQVYNPKYCNGFSSQDLENMHKVAKDSYEKTIQVNQSKLDKKDNSDTLFERLCIHLEKTHTNEKRAILIAATKFYVEEKRPLNKVTIQGYVDTYMLTKGIISYEQYWS